MAAETQYTANTGMVTISTANSNLDGSGTLSSAIITGASNGTLIKTVTIKASGSTTQGMIRLFVYDGTNTKLITEIEVPAVVPSYEYPAFGINVPLDFSLKSGWSLKASTENAENFNVIAEAQDWAYYVSSVRSETTKYTAKNGLAAISTANTNLDGSGTMSTVLTSIGIIYYFNIYRRFSKEYRSTTKEWLTVNTMLRNHGNNTLGQFLLSTVIG